MSLATSDVSRLLNGDITSLHQGMRVMYVTETVTIYWSSRVMFCRHRGVVERAAT